MTHIFHQGAVDFSVGYKVQTTWGFQEAMTFVLEGLGASLFFVALLADNVAGMSAGIVVLVLSGALLMSHLGRPMNMIYVMANFRHSWMSRGAVIIPLFIGLGLLLVLAQGLLGWSPSQGWRQAIQVVFFVLATFTVLKSGLVLSTFPAIAFWNGGLLPVIFALSGLSAGLAVFTAFDAFLVDRLVWLTPALTVALGLALATHLITMKNGSRAAKVSVELIKERHALPFYGAGVGLGIVVPLALGILAAVDADSGSRYLWAAIAVTRLLGDIVVRDVLLKVGVFDKVR